MSLRPIGQGVKNQKQALRRSLPGNVARTSGAFCQLCVKQLKSPVLLFRIISIHKSYYTIAVEQDMIEITLAFVSGCLLSLLTPFLKNRLEERYQLFVKLWQHEYNELVGRHIRGNVPLEVEQQHIRDRYPSLFDYIRWEWRCLKRATNDAQSRSLASTR